MNIKWPRLFRGKKKNFEDGKFDKKKPSLTINTADEEVMPRISRELTMAELEEEAMARGIERRFLPNNKADLLEFLVDGSIYLRKTKAWMDVERLKGAMADDCRRIEEEREMKSQDEQQNPREDLWTSQHDFDQQERAVIASKSTHVYGNKTPPRGDDHTASMSRSTSDDDDNDHFTPEPSTEDSPSTDATPTDNSTLLTADMPGPLTLWNRESTGTTIDMTMMSSLVSPGGSGRYGSFKPQNRNISLQSAAPKNTVMGSFIKALNCTTNVCRTSTGGVNDNVCRTSTEGVTDKEVVVVPKKMKTVDLEREDTLLQEVIDEHRNKWQEIQTQEELELQERWNPFNHFEAWIIAPPSKNMIPTGCMMKGYTVWCNTSRNPSKLFDTTYKNLNDANARARYLFYWRNPWHLPASKMTEVVMIKSDNSAMSGCSNTFHCVHPNGEKWIVSVVNDSTFRYLDNASLQRHDLDQTEEI